MSGSFVGTNKECKAKLVELNGGPVSRTRSGECKGDYPIFRKVSGFAVTDRTPDPIDSGFVFFQGESSYYMRKVHKGLYELRWFVSGTLYRFASGNRGRIRVMGSTNPTEIDEGRLMPFEVFVLQEKYDQHVRALAGWLAGRLDPAPDYLSQVLRRNFPLLSAEVEALGMGGPEWFASIT